MRISAVLASLYVRDLAAAATWYTTLFQRAPDTTPHPQCREWEVLPGARVQVLQAPDARPRSAVALVVVDVSRERERLLRAGAAGGGVGEVVEYPGFVRVVEVTDGDGNVVTLVESLRPAT